MKHYILLLLIAVSFCSCRSSRSMQKELNGMRSNLFYELISQEYTGKVKTDYYSTIKRKGGFFIPLIIFNRQQDRFRTRLGEHSLSQLYREFLTDALLTECNSSTCFQLIDNKDNQVPADSVYRLSLIHI